MFGYCSRYAPGRFIISCAVTAFALLATATPLSAGGGVPMLVTFDDLALGSAQHTQSGVTFQDFNSSNSDGSAHFTVVKPQLGTVSGTQALQSHFEPTGEFGGTHMTLAFDIAQSRISLSTGVAAQGSGAGDEFVLQGFDRDPNGLGGANPIVAAASPCEGNNPTPINVPLQIDDPNASLRYATLSIVACDTPGQLNSGPTSGYLVIDNLSYERALNPPLHEHNPPVVTVIDAANGSTVTGAAPQEIAYRIRATVQEEDLQSVSLSVNGKPAIAMPFFDAGANMHNAGLYVTDKDGLVAGNNTVTVTATDFDNPSNTGSASSTFTFNLKPNPPPSQIDVSPTAFDVTQTIDGGPHFFGQNVFPTLRGFEVPYASQFDVPLIQGKATLIRIFAAVSGSSGKSITSVPASMAVSLANCQNNCEIASGIAPMTGWLSPGIPNTNPTGIDVAPFGPGSDPKANSGNLSASWNFLLPADWTQHNLKVTIQINDGNYKGLPQQPAVDECLAGIAGQCQNDNQITFDLPFQKANDLIVNPVFVHLTGNLQGNIYNDVVSTQAEFDNIIQQLNELYPMNVSAGVRKDITVDPSISNSDLLDKVDDATGLQPCFAIAASPNVWLGVFPDNHRIGAATLGPNLNGVGGTANLGSGACPLPDGWADADDPPDVAHELGHVIGFDHWGCAHKGDEECKDFPNQHGAIDGVAIDIANMRMIPFDNSSLPAHVHDFMTTFVGVCCKWVSAFTYNILMTHSWFATFDADDPTVLVLRGRIATSGVATFKPAYAINVPAPPNSVFPEDDADSLYTILGFDARGNTILVHNFEPEKADLHDAEHRHAFAFVEAIPIMPNLTRVALAKHGRVLGEIRTTTNPTFRPSVAVTSPVAGQRWSGSGPQTVRWMTTLPPFQITHAPAPSGTLSALVSYSVDGGSTRTILQSDVRGNQVTVNSGQLPGSEHAMIFVQLSDGLRSVETHSASFAVDAKPPVVHIVTPKNEGQAIAGMPITLFGSAFDRQETLGPEQLKWFDGGTLLGTGSHLTIANLAPGVHLFTLRVVDGRGLRGSDAVRVHIVPYAVTT